MNPNTTYDIDGKMTSYNNLNDTILLYTSELNTDQEGSDLTPSTDNQRGCQSLSTCDDDESWILIQRKIKKLWSRDGSKSPIIPKNEHVIPIDEIPDIEIFCPPLYTVFDRFSHKKFELNYYKDTLYVINKDNKKVVYICLPNEVFWSDHGSVPRVETVNHAINNICQQCFGSRTVYRGYSTVCGYPVPLKNTGVNKSRKLHGKYIPHSFAVKPDIRDPTASSLAFTTSALPAALSTYMGATYAYDISLVIMKIVTHIGCITTSAPGANRSFVILSALLDLIANPTVRDIIYDFISSDPEVTEAHAMDFDYNLQDAAIALRSPMFNHLDTLVALLVTAGFVKEENITLNGIAMFSAGFSKQSTARDIGSKVLEAIHYLGSVAYECFTTRSFDPIWNVRDDLMNFSKNVSDIVNYLPSIIQGNYTSLYGLDESHFENLLTNTISQCSKIEVMYQTSPAPILSYVRTLSAKLNNARADYTMDKMSRGSRIRPFSIKFFGETGMGKSYINQMTILEVLKANNFPSGPENLCTVNDEKFDSTIKSNSTGVIFDDMCNTKPEQDEFNPAAKMIRFINNICAPAVKADVQDKGKVLIMPKVVGITTNCRDLAANYWSVNEGSILRRCDVHVDTYIRPEFRNEKGWLNPGEVQRTFGDDEIHDIYLLRVMFYNHTTGKLEPYIYIDISGRYPDLDGKPMIGVSIFVFWEWLYDVSRQHFAEQTKLQATMVKSYTAPRCLRCNRHMNMCGCITLERKFAHLGAIPEYDPSSTIKVTIPGVQKKYSKITVPKTKLPILDPVPLLTPSVCHDCSDDESSGDDNSLSTLGSCDEFCVHAKPHLIPEIIIGSGLHGVISPALFPLSERDKFYTDQHIFYELSEKIKRLFDDCRNNPGPRTEGIVDPDYDEDEEDLDGYEEEDETRSMFSFDAFDDPGDYDAHSSPLGTMIGFITNPIERAITAQVKTTLTALYDQLFPSRIDNCFYGLTSTINPMSYVLDYHDKWYAWNNLIPDELIQAMASTKLGRSFILASTRKSRYVRCQLVASALSILTFPTMFYFRKSIPQGSYLAGALTIGVISACSGQLKYEYLNHKLAAGIIPPDKFEAQMYAALDLTPAARMRGARIFKWSINAATLVGAIGVAITAFKAWNTYNAEGQSLNPTTEAEFDERNAKGSFWGSFANFGGNGSVIPTTKTTTQFENTISKNLRFIQFDHGEGSTVSGCNAIWLRADELMLPKHVFYQSNDVKGSLAPVFRYKLTKAPVGSNEKPVPGSMFTTWKSANPSEIRDISPDWVVLSTHALSGDIRDLTKPDKSGNSFFSKKADLPARKLASTIYRSSNGNILTGTTTIQSYGTTNITTASGSFDMYCATMVAGSRTWCKGECGTVIIDRATKHPVILGFHLYGFKARGCSEMTGITFAITQEDIDAHLLATADNLFAAHSITPVPMEINNQKLNMSSEIPAHSPSNFCTGNFDVIGSIVGNSHYKTALVKTCINASVVKKFPDLKFAPPDFKNFRPFDDFLEHSSNVGHHLDRDLLKRCVDDYLKPLLPLVGKSAYLKKYVRPLTNLEIVNGIHGVRFMDRMKGNSAMGFPYVGQRSKFLMEISNVNGVVIRDWKDSSIWVEFARLEECYFEGEILSHPFKSSLKDELRPENKLKPRVFQAAPLFLQLFIRKYFLPLILFLGTFPLDSECAVGINAMSEEWETMVTHVIGDYLDRLFGGDYKEFDQRIEKELSYATYTVFLRLARAFGYSERDLKVMAGISTDLMNVVVLIFGAVIRLAGGNASGQNATTPVNSVDNSIRFRYMYFRLHPESIDFRSQVRLITYGDDAVASSAPGCKLNFNTYRDELAKFDIEFTLPTKEKMDVYPDFLPLDQLDFLKRKSVLIPELGYRVGALEPASIWKSLLYYNKESPITEAAILASTIESATFELAGHGRQFYDENMIILREFAKEAGVITSMLDITFDDKICHLSKETPVELDDYSATPCASDTTMIETILDLVGVTSQEKGATYIPHVATIRYNTNERLIIPSRVSTAETAVDSVGTPGEDSSSDGISRYFAHAEEQSTSADTSSAAVVSFSLGEDGMEVVSGDNSDPTKYIGLTTDVSLSEFLARPILYTTYTWAVGSSIQNSFNPVREFLINPAVASKINNYAYITGKMHVKVTNNGTPFHFGKAIMAYEPWGLLTRQPNKYQLTTLPYVTISPADEVGGTLTFDLMHQQNYIDLTQFGVADESLARIWIDTICTLTAVSTTTAPITVQVYLWMSDVKFCMTTNVLPSGTIPTAFQAQSGEMETLSQNMPQTDIMSRLYKMPYIGKYMKASSIAMTAGSQIASLFGYSKPCVYHDDIKAVPTYTGNLTNVNTFDSSVKLTLDHKAEVFVDNVVTGSGTVGDMDIVAIAKKEMLIIASIFTGNLSYNNKFATLNVTPCISINQTGYTILTPMSQVASCFRHWRGSMVIRVEIVASAFHKGKIRVAYDPIGGFSSTNSYNTTYSHIIDLSESREYTFCIGWGNNKNFLFTQDPTTVNTTTGSTNPSSLNNRFHNGQVTLSIVTPLTVSLQDPALSQVFVNVYANMTDDFEVGQPWGDWMKDKEMYIVPDSTRPALLSADAPAMVAGKSQPVFFEAHATSMELPIADRAHELDLCLNKVPMHIDGGELSGIHHGERVRSIRQLMKRYCYVDSLMFYQPPLSGGSVFRNFLHTVSIPLFRRYTLLQPSINIPLIGNYRVARTTFINWFLPSYVGFRGSTRWKYFIMDRQSSSRYHDIYLSPNTAYLQGYNEMYAPSVSSDNLIWRSTTYASQSEQGQSLSFPYLNPSLEVEVPYYGAERFKVIRTLEFSDPTLPSNCRPLYHCYTLYCNGVSSDIPAYIPVNRHFATGDDFSLVFYKFPPVIYVRNTPLPAP